MERVPLHNRLGCVACEIELLLRDEGEQIESARIDVLHLVNEQVVDGFLAADIALRWGYFSISSVLGNEVAIIFPPIESIISAKTEVFGYFG